MNFAEYFNNYKNITIEVLNKEILKFSLSLYNNKGISTRAVVTDIFDIFDDFVNEFFIPYIINQLSDAFNPVTDTNNFCKAKFVLDNCKNIFDKFKTEKLRFNVYEDESVYVPPELHKVTSESVIVKKEDGTGEELVEKDINIAYIPLKKSLESVFKIPGFFKQTIEYVDKLSKETSFLSNFIQAKLWKIKYLPKYVGKIVFPLYLFYDDFESGNALGSSAGEQKLGGVYASLACIPPHLIAKLEHVFVTTIAYSKHIKALGNKKIFSKTIEDLNFLSKEGIEIDVDGQKERIYFECVLVLGDNLGMNCICGFSGSFSATRFCRICTATAAECEMLTAEDPELVRTYQLYQNNLLANNPSLTGIYEQCVFNSLDLFHISENMSGDIMHDGKLGIFIYTLEKILNALIKEKIISLDVINRRILNFPYNDTEKPNKPRPLFFSASKKGEEKLKIKQSASQMLCLCTYLGLMIGDLIPSDNKYWKLYLILRQIVGLLFSPSMSRGHISMIEKLITKHNKMYIRLFGKLKPKMHIWIHYIRIILLNGPIVHLSSDVYERKNKDIMDGLAGNKNNINTPITAAIMHQLSLCYSTEYSPIADTDVIPGSIKDLNAYNQLKRLVPELPEKKVMTYKYIKILGKKFSEGTIFISEVTPMGPLFEVLKEIYFVDKEFYLLTNSYEVLRFDSYYHAYNVQASTESDSLINVRILPRLPPCLIIEKEGQDFIMTRFDV